jgi:translation initiation factor IF-3
MDYGKFIYQRHKQDKESKKKGAGQKSIKEIKLGVKTEEHDLQTKVRHIMEFLADGHKVKLIIIYRGREMAHPELGRELLARVIQLVSENGAPEYAAKLEGHALVTILGPHSKQVLDRLKKDKEKEKKAAGEDAAAGRAEAQKQAPAPVPSAVKQEEENKVG